MKARLLLTLWLLPCFCITAFAQYWETEVLRQDIVGAWIRTGDIDSDGDPDMVIQAGDSIYWHENLRPGWAPHLIDATFYNSEYAWVDIQDLDGDGDLDVLKAPVSGTLDNPLTWDENVSNGTSWVQHNILNVPGNLAWMQGSYGDIDGDGDLDLVVPEYNAIGGGSLYWLENMGDAASYDKHPIENGAFYFSTVADLDGDGDPDIAAGTQQLYWLENQLPDTTWTQHQVSGTSNNNYHLYGDCSDFNGDGVMDIISNYINGNSGLAKNSFYAGPNWTETVIMSESDVLMGELADFDNDGDMDITYGGSGFSGILQSLGWAENHDNGTEWIKHAITPAKPTQQFCSGIADVDGDGDLDAVSLDFETNGATGFVFWAANPLIEVPNINIHSVATVRQVGGDHGYTLDGIHMTNHSRPKLLNPDNFGVGGVYQKSISITDAYGSSGSLEAISSNDDVGLFFFGVFNTLESSYIPLTEAEIDSLYAWSERGGKLIIGASAPGNPNVHIPNVLNDKWGFDVVLNFPSTNIVPTDEGAGTAIFDGPFGAIPSANQGGFAKGYFNLIPENVVILGEDADGNATLLLDCKTLDLIIADGDAYTDLGGVSIGPDVSNNNDRFWLNTIAYMDQLQGPPVVAQDGNTLSAGGYLNYQWLLNGEPIAGATDSVYTPAVSGNYSVLVSMSCGCEVTSEEVFVAVSGVEGPSPEFEISLFPNPATGWVTLNLPAHGTELFQVQIFDVNGRLLLSNQIQATTSLSLNLSGLSPGAYVVRVSSESASTVRRMVKY